MYCSIPYAGRTGNVILFVIVACVIISMYGGGFATVPAYLKDLFGTMNDRVFEALQQLHVAKGLSTADLQAASISVYSFTMYLMAGLLIIGLVCNLSVRQVADRFLYRGEGAGLPGVAPSQATPYAPTSR